MRMLLPAIVVLAASALLGGCSYYWQAVGGQIELLRKQTPIEEVLENPETSPQTRQSLRRILEIRRFAIAELGLPDNGSYSSYVDLGRAYVVWNVVAAEEFSVDPLTWCFPFAGCVSYRGYFDEAAARQFSARLDGDGLDTALGGATAYSTLGYFADPVLNTMIASGEQSVAALLFHELAQQRFYIKDDSEINEAFATTVEEHGTELWLMRSGPVGAIAEYRRGVRRRTEFAELVGRQQDRLRALYAREDSVEVKRDAKQTAFDTMRSEYVALKRSWGGATDYDAWFARPLNNAHLASVATYRRWLPGLRWLLGVRGLDGFYTEMDALGESSMEERRARLEEWLDSAVIVRSAGGNGTVHAGGAGSDLRGSVAERPPSRLP